MTVRTRFAPSPTGYLHIGGARTALYSWLYARRQGGKFILRIEDTDAARSTDENTREILEGMKWLGLAWDEGPILQSSRTQVYRDHVEKLLAAGKAYRCYCTKEELEAKRRAAEKAKTPFRYDRTCRRRTTPPPAGAPYVIRAAFEESGTTVIDDLVKGRVESPNAELSDEVILRADGSPMYNLCVVIDDHDMGVTHVLRGDDHLNNTPKQIQLYKSFGWETPKFGHVPLIFGPDGKKLSKRSPPKDPSGKPIKVAVSEYKEAGYLPEAMINFLVRIGWSHGDEEIFSIDRLKEVFDLEGIGKSAGMYDLKKLDSLNKEWIAKLPPEEIGRRLVPFFEKRGWKKPDDATLARMVECMRTRPGTTLETMADQLAFWFVEEPPFDAKAVDKFLKGRRDIVSDAAAALAKVEPFDNEHVFAAIEGLASARGAKTNDVAQPVRVAATGVTIGPPINDVLTLLGKQRTAARLEKALAKT